MMKFFSLGLFAVLLTMLLVGCESGNSDELSEAVRLADLDINSIEVTPADGTIKTGYSYQFVATGIQSDGTRVDVSEFVNWSSSNSALTSVNDVGLVSTAQNGAVTISARLSVLSGATSITASSAALVANGIDVQLNGANPSACSNVQLTAVGTYVGEAGPRNIIPLTDFVTWSVISSNGEISTSGYLQTWTNGLPSATLSGVINIEASLDGEVGALSVTPENNLASIAVTPSSATINAGDTLQYTATGTYIDSSIINITNNVEWISSDTVTAIFDLAGKGEITAKIIGGAFITASCGSINTDSAQVSLSITDDDFLRVELRDTNSNNLIDAKTLAVGSAVRISLWAVYSNREENVTDDSSTIWTVQSGTTDTITVSNPVSANNTDDDYVEVTGVSAGNDSVKGEFSGDTKQLFVTVN